MSNEIRDIHFAADPLWLCPACGHKVTYGSSVSRLNGSWVHETCATVKGTKGDK